MTACARQLEVADATRLRGRPRRAASVGSSTVPRTPIDRAALDDQLVDPVPEREADPAGARVRAHPPLERLDHARARCPR